MTEVNLDLAAQLKARHEERDAFLEKYPGESVTYSVILGTVLSCPESGMNIVNVKYQEAWDHIQSCAWCRNNHQIAKENRLAQYARR